MKWVDSNRHGLNWIKLMNDIYGTPAEKNPNPKKKKENISHYKETEGGT